MSGTLSISGIVSGMDTSSIISKMQTLESQPITQLQNQQTQLTTQSQAWTSAEADLLTVKTAADSLANLTQQPSMTASSSDTTVGVSASSGAQAGQYTFSVTSVAAYHQQTSQAYTAENTPLGSGTVTIASNGNSTTIDTANMTLDGLRDAINKQTDVGVSAIVVSDGAATPSYRLLLTSDTLGSAGKMTVTSTLPSDTNPVMSDLQAATDTVLQFGTGVNAFTVTRSNSSITDVLPGVTINPTAASVGKTVTVQVAPDTAGMQNAMQTFVSQYNNYINFVNQQNQFDSKTNTTGTLFGNYTLFSAQSEIYSNFISPVSGLPDSMSSVAQLGITLGADGKLSLNTSTFSTAVANHLSDVLRMFGTTATSTNAGVSYVGSTDATKVSGSTGYDVNVTQLATKSALTLSTQLPATTTNAETLTLNGASISITAGMTPTQVMQAINAQSGTSNVTATLTGADGTGTGNYLTLTQQSYGSTAHIAINSSLGGAGSLGIGTDTITDSTPGANIGSTGLDVAGTINGAAATGAGQFLTSQAGNSQGLELKIATTATGDYGNVVFSRGVGSLISNQLTSFTDPTNGAIAGTQTSLTTQQTALSDQITRMQKQVTDDMTRLQNQYNNMEAALAQLQSQSSALSSMITGMTGSTVTAGSASTSSSSTG